MVALALISVAALKWGFSYGHLALTPLIGLRSDTFPKQLQLFKQRTVRDPGIGDGRDPSHVYVGALIFSSLRGVSELNDNEEAVLGLKTSLKIHANGNNEILCAYRGAMISYNNIIVCYNTTKSYRGMRDAFRQDQAIEFQRFAN